MGRCEGDPTERCVRREQITGLSSPRDRVHTEAEQPACDTGIGFHGLSNPRYRRNSEIDPKVQ